ncbi:MAG: hypothetical protein IJS99_02325 [Synergistaceae bacterium]|nr:hypothetical protein [Synergistaceae bacterium]
MLLLENFDISVAVNVAVKLYFFRLIHNACRDSITKIFQHITALLNSPFTNKISANILFTQHERNDELYSELHTSCCLMFKIYQNGQ